LLTILFAEQQGYVVHANIAELLAGQGDAPADPVVIRRRLTAFAVERERAQADIAALTTQAPPEPSSDAPLIAWFDYRDALLARGDKPRWRDLAAKSRYSEATLRTRYSKQRKETTKNNKVSTKETTKNNRCTADAGEGTPV
jgi:hypothetical protein